MARVIWTDPALIDLRDIAEYIELENPEAAKRFTRRVFAHVELLKRHPRLGPVPHDFPDSDVRQLVESPSRVFYRVKGDIIFIVHVLRFERRLRPSRLVLDE